jgi:hypothetical protein
LGHRIRIFATVIKRLEAKEGSTEIVEIDVSSLDQPLISTGSRSRFMVNSIFCDCRLRHLSTERAPEKRNGPSSGELEAVMQLADTVPGEVFNCDRDQ